VTLERSAAAFVALGSNLGDRDANLALAVRSLAALPEVAVAALSPVYETRPVGPPQGPYLNAVAELRTTLPPRPLLDAMLEIETRAGRARSAEARASWGPRTLDLDLLFYADRQIDEPGLEVPHPRLHQRAFVLVPLCALAPELHHPRLDVSIRCLAARLEEADRGGVRRWPLGLSLPAGGRSE
jgi:2-amino-4-hydroxy-6-hydroxymethyldihydropteridine diphosphokinase